MGYLASKTVLGYKYSSILSNSESVLAGEVSNKDKMVIYIMDLNCQFSNNEKIVNHINELVNQAKTLSITTDFNIKFLLVTINDPYSSTTLLSNFESVDEVIFGNQWQNLAVNNYLLQNGYTEKSTPQLLIVERDNILINHGNNLYFQGFSQENILYHVESMNEIIEFNYMNIFK